MGNATATKALSAKDSAFEDETTPDTRFIDSTDLNEAKKVYVGQVAQDCSDEKKQDYAGTLAQGRTMIDIPACEVISMTKYWEEFSTPADFVGWVVDEDGWAYWSRQLKGGEATGYLLNSVQKKAALNSHSYTYNINITYEAVTAEDMGLWVNGSGTLTEGVQNGTLVENVGVATDEALMLLRNAGWRDGNSQATLKLDEALDARMDAHVADIDGQQYKSKGAKRLYKSLKRKNANDNWNMTSSKYKILHIAKNLQQDMEALVASGETEKADKLLTEDVSSQFTGNIKNGIVKALTMPGETEVTSFTQDDLNSIWDIRFYNLTGSEVETLYTYKSKMPNIYSIRLNDLQTESLDVNQFPFNQALGWNIIDSEGATAVLNQIGGTKDVLDFSQCTNMQSIHMELRGGTPLTLVFPSTLQSVSLFGDRVATLNVEGLSNLEYLRAAVITKPLSISGWKDLHNLRVFLSSQNMVPLAEVDLSVCSKLLQIYIASGSVTKLILPTDSNALHDGVGVGGGYSIVYGSSAVERKTVYPEGIVGS